MIGMLPILILLALHQDRINEDDLAKEVMKKAVAKNASDNNILRENYDFDVIKNQKTAPGQKANDDQLSIADLLRQERYRYEMDDSIPLYLNEQPIYLIRFFPRRNKLNAPKKAGRREKIKNEIMNNLYGIIYISRDDFGIIRIVAHLDSSPKRISIVGRLYLLEAIFEQSRLANIWAPKEIEVKAEFSYFFGWHRSFESTKIEFRNFRLKPPP